MIRLPISRARADYLASWLSDRTGVESRYFKTKISNKFPGLSSTEANVGVSGMHLYLEAANIESDTKWYGKLSDLRLSDQEVWYTYLPPKDFDGSRYFQYAGVVSGVPDLSSI